MTYLSTSLKCFADIHQPSKVVFCPYYYKSDCWIPGILGYNIGVSQAWISNYIPQFTVGCNYLSLPEIPASGNKVLIYSVICVQHSTFIVVLRFLTYKRFNRIPEFSVFIFMDIVAFRIEIMSHRFFCQFCWFSDSMICSQPCFFLLLLKYRFWSIAFLRQALLKWLFIKSTGFFTGFIFVYRGMFFDNRWYELLGKPASVIIII